MRNDQIADTPASPLRHLCDRAQLGDEAKSLLNDDFSTKEFIGLLVEKELFRDAIRLVAYLLPKREAVGWGCLCMRYILTAEQKSSIPDVQVAAEQWVSAPNDENRWAAREIAEKENPKSPSGLLAMAAFFAGPSMAPPNLHAVPPPEHATPEIVSGAMLLAGVAVEPQNAKEKYRVFMQKASALMARMKQPAQP